MVLKILQLYRVYLVVDFLVITTVPAKAAWLLIRSTRMTKFAVGQGISTRWLTLMNGECYLLRWILLGMDLCLLVVPLYCCPKVGM